DEGDVGMAVGPAGPPNTLRSFSIGATPANLLQEAHHNITVLALSDDGSRIVFFDDSTAGGTAGIGTSPNFGLFVFEGGSKTQLDTYGDRWDAATYSGASSFIAAKHNGGTETLVQVNGTAMATLDSIPGDGPAQVYSVSG